MSEYRIVEKVVSIPTGHGSFYSNRFCGERKVRFFGLFSFWWPVLNYEWRQSYAQAKLDIQEDARIRSSKTRIHNVDLNVEIEK